MVNRSQKRQATHLLTLQGMSQRTACRLLGLARSVYRYKSKKKDDSDLIEILRKLTFKNRRYGYRRLYIKIRKMMVVNHKRIYRLYCQEGLKLRIKQRRKRSHCGIKNPMLKATKINECWSMDFMADSLKNSRRFRIFNIIDNFSRKCLAAYSDFSITSMHVLRVLEKVISIYGKPKQILLDNGPEYTYV